MSAMKKLFLFICLAIALGSTLPADETGTPSVPSTGGNSAVAPVIPVWLDPVHQNYWQIRFHDNVAHSRQRPVDLLFEGDSITDYWREKQGNDIWMQRYDKLNAFDFGITGDGTQNVLWRLQHGEVDSLHPKLISLLIGRNNMGGNTPEEISQGVQAIIGEFQKRCPGSPILLQAIFPSGPLPSDPVRSKIKATNQLISKLSDGKHVLYLDFSDKFLEPDGTISVEMMPDFLHPSTKGYQIWADAIQPVIDKFFPQDVFAK